jgi:phosphonate transport system substrate-binding protein
VIINRCHRQILSAAKPQLPFIAISEGVRPAWDLHKFREKTPRFLELAAGDRRRPVDFQSTGWQARSPSENRHLLVTRDKMPGFALPIRNTARWICASVRVAFVSLLLGGLLTIPGGFAWAEAGSVPLRFGLTPAVLHDQYSLLADWRRYLEQKLQRPVEFVLRDKYRETIDLLKERQLDFAWVSDYPYVYLEDRRIARLLATPVYQGRPYYRAYLIVPAGDTKVTSLQDLKGTVFAYADSYSHTGFIVPRYDIWQSGTDPDTFFRQTFFTWSHHKLIDAVGGGYADGGSVDSFVWDTLSRIHPEVTARTRVVAQSPEFGFPPIVAAQGVAAKDFAAMQRVLLAMGDDPVGTKLLERLNIDGFTRGDTRLYADVRTMARAVGEP